MKAFPHPIVRQQAAEKQPPFMTWLILFIAGAWLPTMLAKALMTWPGFVRLVDAYHELYLSCFFGLQLAISIGVPIYVRRNFASALWIPRSPLSKHYLFAILLGLPLFAYHFVDLFRMTPHLIRFWTLPPGSDEVPSFLKNLHQLIWGRMPYGPSLVGITCFSLLTLFGPFFEETLYSGLLANRLLNHTETVVALLTTPLVFALAHLPSFGFRMEIAALYLAGLTYTAVRFVTGSLGFAIGCHILINALVIAPKWMIAVLHFKHS